MLKFGRRNKYKPRGFFNGVGQSLRIAPIRLAGKVLLGAKYPNGGERRRNSFNSGHCIQRRIAHALRLDQKMAVNDFTGHVTCQTPCKPIFYNKSCKLTIYDYKLDLTEAL